MSLGRLEYLTLSVSVNKFTHLQSSFGFYLRSLVTIFVGLLLTACAAPLVALSSSGTAAASSVGTSAAAIAIANPTTAVSAVSTVSTGKSPLEHAASAATKKECNFLNALGPKPICEEIPVPSVTDRSVPYFGPADALKTPANQ